MTTITVQIGTSDDKLTQVQWSQYVERVHHHIEAHCLSLHFFGGSQNWTAWQNVAWVFECANSDVPSLKEGLTVARMAYGQESVAYSESVTVFL